MSYDIKHPSGNKRNVYEYGVYELLNVAKKDLDQFWMLLYCSTDSIFANVETTRSGILEILREWLPVRRKFKRGEIYAIFEGLMEEPPVKLEASSEAFQQRFRDWRDKNIKPFKYRK